MRVKLSAVLEALEMQGDEVHASVDRVTGDVVVLTDEELGAAEDEADPSEFPEWQRPNIEQAKAVQADEGGRFVALPDRFEIDEWRMMRDFAMSLPDEGASSDLLDAIHGRGAFRLFKDCLRRLDKEKAWFAFRDAQYRQVAVDWCHENGIEVEENA